MPTMLITCPESAHLEEIDFIQSPLGILIRRCSAAPGKCLRCPRTCATRLDRKLACRELLIRTMRDVLDLLREPSA
jgi:hypothetical protein